MVIFMKSIGHTMAKERITANLIMFSDVLPEK